jgi:hypothetical protein
MPTLLTDESLVSSQPTWAEESHFHAVVAASHHREASAPKPILATPVGRCHHLKTVGEAAVMCEPARGEKDSPGGVASECVGPSRCGNPKRVAFGEAVRKCRSR